MGYRSEVAYAILFNSQKDRDTVLAELTPEQQEIINADAKVQPTQILYHRDYIKWYATVDLGRYGINGYAEVDAHEALLKAAQDAYEDDRRIISLGVFYRLGEEDDDSDRRVWGDEEPGFPDPWDLIGYRRELIINWKED